MYDNLAILAAFAFLFSAIAGRNERSAVTGPMIYVLLGLLAGPMVFGVLKLDVQAVELRVIADLTLALVLFIDAANANLSTLRTHAIIPRRMLLIGLPLAIAMGIGAGVVIFPDLGFYEVCLLATMLAATDAALGKGVVTNEAVPARLREGLNVESGLNDGMCVPVLLVFLALATGESHGEGGAFLALTLVAKEIGIGAVVGIVFAYLAVKILRIALTRGWFTDIWAQIPVVVLALACFATADRLHGSGYIAAFVGGLLFGNMTRRTHELVQAGEGIAELLAMMTWIVFGAVAVGQSWLGMTWPVLIYSLLSLTVIRMLPNILALTRSGEGWEPKFFLGWFGPRGLASIVFFVIVANAHLPGESIMKSVVVCTITLCIFAHGVTANAWAKRMANGQSNTSS
jgi:NhaP-type Na+/H+ or K+/H+ antiporter